MLTRLSTLALVLWVAQAHADGEKFYSVMGPDGGIQLIRSAGPEAAEPEVAENKAANKKPGRKRRQSADAPASPPAADAEGGASAAAQVGHEPAAVPVAAYDSDQYVDSESLDQALSQPVSKQRFYVINDGVGTQLNQMDGTALEASSVPVDTPDEEFQALAIQPAILRGDEATRALPGLTRCLSRERTQAMRLAGLGLPVSTLINKQTYVFLDDSRVVAGFHLEGEGLRTLLSESFSRRDRRPAFVTPQLAFLDEQGCLTRTLTGFFDRLYPATPRRHPALRADLLVHTGEAYLLVLAPESVQQKASAAAPYELSGYGQLQFTLRK